MPALRERPLFTDVHPSLDVFIPEAGSSYVFGTAGEDRAAHSREWEAQAGSVHFVRITAQGADDYTADLGQRTTTVALRSKRQIEGFLSDVGDPLYLDITGLSHHVWAPLVRGALQARKTLRVVYVEPSDYRLSANPKEGGLFDLSEGIEGIRPIHGFSVLDDQQDVPSCFVPLLGFEGARFAYILEEVEPAGDRMVPVVGVPGFRLEFPFHTYHGNQVQLREWNAWRQIRFAIANDPFSVFYLLDDIARSFPGSLLKVAPIGTKPHALGAIMYAIEQGRRVELVYDHPVRKEKRTSGSARTLVYHVSVFMQ